MPTIKKSEQLPEALPEEVVIEAFMISAEIDKETAPLRGPSQFVSKYPADVIERVGAIRERFREKHGRTHYEILQELDKWFDCFNIPGDLKLIQAMYARYTDSIHRSEKEPTKMNPRYLQWAFKGYIYQLRRNPLTDDEVRLLILEHFDKERQRFEELKRKFDATNDNESSGERKRIPESVRIEVWRRDGGKCARCGSRERLEYDHIVPVSKGGNNTARNIELLCEKHNRSKSDNPA